jgi:hypothetical protein
MNIIVRVLINLIIVIGIFFYYSQVYGMELKFWKKEEVKVIVEPIKTLDSEITRLSAEYKVDEKLVRAIIKCESSMYGSAINHNKIDGVVWSSDFGLMQINDYYHEKTMEKLGFDIRNEFDSLKYGIILLSTQGTSPWKASSKCWENEIK